MFLYTFINITTNAQDFATVIRAPWLASLSLLCEKLHIHPSGASRSVTGVQVFSLTDRGSRPCRVEYDCRDSQLTNSKTKTKKPNKNCSTDVFRLRKGEKKNTTGWNLSEFNFADRKFDTVVEVYLRVTMVERWWVQNAAVVQPCIRGGRSHPNVDRTSANARIGIGSIVTR